MSEFLDASTQALRTSTGDGALAELGWWELLADLHDAEARAAVLSLFRAQGRVLATSPALGGLLALPFAEALGAESGSTVAAIARRSPRRGGVLVVVGHPGARRLLVDRPGHGAFLLDAADVALRPIDVPGGLDLYEVDVDLAATTAALPDGTAAAARARATRLGRLAAAVEMLGAAEGAVDLAVGHANARHQFGAPIGMFQAVRHLLAWAATDCAAVEAVTSEAIALHDAAPAGYDAVVKAIAGRNGRRACERALQVLGGIGFTADHDHHRFHSRVLALDALLGTSAELTHRLGQEVRSMRADPALPAQLLLAASEGRTAR